MPENLNVHDYTSRLDRIRFKIAEGNSNLSSSTANYFKKLSKKLSPKFQSSEMFKLLGYIEVRKLFYHCEHKEVNSEYKHARERWLCWNFFFLWKRAYTSFLLNKKSSITRGVGVSKALHRCAKRRNFGWNRFCIALKVFNSHFNASGAHFSERYLCLRIFHTLWSNRNQNHLAQDCHEYRR